MQLKRSPEKESYIKGRKIVRSCENLTQLFAAYRWIWLYKSMYGKTKSWEDLYKYCTQRRNRL